MFTGGIKGDFAERMVARSQKWAIPPISARIFAPDDLIWWYWQEHGTASRGEAGGAPYPIDPVNAKALAFPDAQGKLVFRQHVEHPGIAPRHSVLKAIPDIEAQSRTKLAAALTDGGLDNPSTLQTAVTAAVTEAKAQIVTSMSENIPGTRIDGKLAGDTAASVFDAEAEVIENGE